MLHLRKQKILVISLLLTLLATAYTYLNENRQVVVTVSGSSMNSSSASPDKYALLAQNPIKTHRPTESRRLFYTPRIDIFEVYVPTKAKELVKDVIIIKNKPTLPKKSIVLVSQPPVQPPPLPSIPALPFRYIGKLFGDDEYVVFLSLHGKSLSVKLGDVLQQTYRIEEIKPPLMQVTYLPMNIKQTLMIGEP